MPGDKSKRNVLVMVMVWLIIIIIIAVLAKFLGMPFYEKYLKKSTGTESQYKQTISIAADTFSGYAILRSEAMKKELKAQGIKLEIVDDNADYIARAKALEDEKVQMAVYTVDSYLTAGAAIGKFPASIVMVIDETKGGDGIVAYKGSVANFNDLNHPDARFVLTPNSPSEFLARVIVAEMNLPLLPEKWWEEADGAKDVYKRFRSGARDKTARKVYVLWQPYISRALGERDAYVLFDTSKLSGYIVDVLVVERHFLRDNPEQVRMVVEAYFRALNAYSQTPDGLVQLVKEDAKLYGSENLSTSQAEEIVQGIMWKNTLENYAHFGLITGSKDVPYLEDSIGKIMTVLLKTDALSEDPLAGKYNELFYQATLKEMQSSGFHPGKKLNIVDGMGPDSNDLDQIRTDNELAALSDEQWEELMPVGTMRVEPIGFLRGTSNLSIVGKRELDNLASRLEAWPNYYLTVVGQTRSEGDQDANRILAKERADTVTQYLINSGINPNRLKAEAAASSGDQVVSFTLGQLPY